MENHFVWGDSFDQAWIEYFFHDKREVFKRYFHERKHRIDTTDFSYRALKHWDSIGLIYAPRHEEKWRKYNFLDIIWVNLIFQFRHFGLPLETILGIGNKIWKDESNKSLNLQMLEFYTACAMLKQQDVYFLVFSNYQFFMCNSDEYQLNLDIYKGIDKTHLKICVTDIIKRLFPIVEFGDFKITKTSLSSEEMEILLLIRKGTYETISIKTNKGKVEIIEFTERFNPETKIGEIIRKGEYQNISIRQKNGKVIELKSITTKKIKTEK